MTTHTATLTPMAKPLTDDERQAIRDALEAGGGCAEVAKQFGRAPDTVSRIAKSMGHRFGVTNLARAHEARHAYTAEARAKLASEATTKAFDALAELERDQPIVTTVRGETMVDYLRPDARAWRDLAAAVGTLTKVVLDIDRHDNKADDSAAAVDAWLEAMTNPQEDT